MHGLGVQSMKTPLSDPTRTQVLYVTSPMSIDPSHARGKISNTNAVRPVGPENKTCEFIQVLVIEAALHDLYMDTTRVRFQGLLSRRFRLCCGHMRCGVSVRPLRIAASSLSARRALLRPTEVCNADRMLFIMHLEFCGS